MKQILYTFLVSLLLLCPATHFAQTRISILGDSYSTYGGYVTPATNLCWYNGTDGGDKTGHNDVSSVDQTWWRLLLHDGGYLLDTNNSYSGSTVCHTGYRKEDYSDRSFITRVHCLGNPDIILVFGGTNDSWAGSPVGEFQYAGWTKADLYAFRPAFAYLLASLRALYPAARIYNLTNSELSTEVTESMETICRYYAVPNIRLHDVDKQWGHPSIAGMKASCEQVLSVLKAR